MAAYLPAAIKMSRGCHELCQPSRNGDKGPHDTCITISGTKSCIFGTRISFRRTERDLELMVPWPNGGLHVFHGGCFERADGCFRSFQRLIQETFRIFCNIREGFKEALKYRFGLSLRFYIYIYIYIY